MRTRVFNKLVDLNDALNLVKRNDTIAVGGFVAQNSPETLLEGLGNRYIETKPSLHSPGDLTILFGGGPGDYNTKGLNHLGKEGLLRRSIGAHYGQVPKIAKLVLENKILGWALPMGSISRIYRAVASATPGHITRIGLNTFVDPRLGGGKLNKKTKDSIEQMVHLITIDEKEYLRYSTLPIQVCFIKATTADEDGNLTFEKESMYGDNRIIASATKASGGIVIAEVERIAARHSIGSRSIHIPGIMVDYVVKQNPLHHGMSYFTQYDPSWSSEIKEPSYNFTPMTSGIRKWIARRAAMELKPNDLVNLGIGMPEGVAKVSAEEGVFENITLTTEAGLLGGVGASGKDFGPASGASGISEMNVQFDLYNGGSLSKAFLGLAEANKAGDVNVSRLSEDSLTGPGGFIDITQPTRNVLFLGTFTKGDLKIEFDEIQKKLCIIKEGKHKTFKNSVREVTFSASHAINQGQKVLYITERCVFELNYRGLKLIEVAPGIDIEKDIIKQMDFIPYIPKDEVTGLFKVKVMDPIIFSSTSLVGIKKLNFDFVQRLQSERLTYSLETNTLHMDFSNLTCPDGDTMKQIGETIERKILEILNIPSKIQQEEKKFHCVINYDNFDIRSDLVPKWIQVSKKLQDQYYKSCKRFTGTSFLRTIMFKELQMATIDDIWEKWSSGRTKLSREMLRKGIAEDLHFHINPANLDFVTDGLLTVSKDEFSNVIYRVNKIKRGELKI